ncbi:MAG TPA: cupin domain-containing protein [Terracidiphilus sp.]|jgi:mannose-6-phosphate isomerase-like protein (cupin superfamily)|nr:cupin domain-containing protein [Terracidiphilus sp.]
MKRRSFLKTAAAAFPIAGLQAFAFAAPEPASTDQLHLIGAGQDRFGESHSLGFSRILFKVGTRETNGGLFVIEHVNLVKGGPRLHLHLHQDEYFYVMEGEVLFQVGDHRIKLHAGESILGPRGIPHTFSATGGTPGHMLIAFTPAGKMEQFFRDTAIPDPPVQDAAFFRKYDMELIGPSPFAA